MFFQKIGDLGLAGQFWTSSFGLNAPNVCRGGCQKTCRGHNFVTLLDPQVKKNSQVFWGCFFQKMGAGLAGFGHWLKRFRLIARSVDHAVWHHHAGLCGWGKDFGGRICLKLNQTIVCCFLCWGGAISEVRYHILFLFYSVVFLNARHEPGPHLLFGCRDRLLWSAHVVSMFRGSRCAATGEIRASPPPHPFKV